MHPLADIFGVKPDITAAQECARAALIFVYGLTLIRISGRRTFGKWSALDVIVSVTAGSALSRALTGNALLWGTLAATGVLVLLHMLASKASAHFRSISRIIEGRQVVLAENGKVDERARQRYLVSLADLEEALHRKGMTDPAEAGRITLEPNGTINASGR